MEKQKKMIFEELADMVGGKFQLTALMQKRLRELVRGARPLVDMKTENLQRIVMEEIRTGKIKLEKGPDVMDELRSKAAQAKAEAPKE